MKGKREGEMILERREGREMIYRKGERDGGLT